MREPMERRYYNATSLERVLGDLEEHYGMSSEEFYARHLADDVRVSMPSFTRHTWASFYRNLRRLRGDDFAEHAERTLALS
jgi:hypothetical protein